MSVLLIVLVGSLIGSSAQQSPLELAAVLSETCPSESTRGTTHQDIRTQVQSLLNLPTFQPPCAGGGLWHRVLFINMSDTTQQCPSALTPVTYYANSRRSCGWRNPNAPINGYCTSNKYRVDMQYSEVCGRIIGYTYGQSSAFKSYYTGSQTSIDSPYVDGISLTHGFVGQRQHIWTFAGSFSDISSSTQNQWSYCPCTSYRAISPPPFVGNDYFCESGNDNPSLTSPSNLRFYPNDPLWDGQNCGGPNGTTCCAFNNPPWFTKTLPTPTSDSIELRMCASNPAVLATPIELIELYVR